MFFKAAACQCRFILKQKWCLFTFALLLAWVLINFVGNVLTFQGMDAAEMYQPMKLLLLSYNRINYNADFTLLLVQLYPFLVACPAAFSLVKERQTGQEVLMSARLGRFPYFMGKLAAVMAVTAAVFTLPFLIEILLNCIAFPLNAQGDLTNWDAYDPDYVASVKHYLCYPLYLFSPYLYAVCGTLLFGGTINVGDLTVAAYSVDVVFSAGPAAVEQAVIRPPWARTISPLVPMSTSSSTTL